MALHIIESNDIRSLKPVTFEKVKLKERGSSRITVGHSEIGCRVNILTEAVFQAFPLA